MDPYLFNFVSSDTPHLNPLLANGLAVEHMKSSEKYLDDIFQDVFKNFNNGLTYLGLKRISPYEEYDQTKKKQGKNKRPVYDLARSDLYMVKVRFNLVDAKGDSYDINRYLYLPYVGEAGEITLSAARFFISPVLSDKIISIGLRNIFVRLLCDKLTFERVKHTVVVNGRRESIDIPWALIYHKSARMNSLHPRVKANTAIAHYMFAKFGVRETFRLYTTTMPIFGEGEINQLTYPEEDWVIFSSSYVGLSIKPKGCRNVYDWKPTKIKVAVKRSELTAKVKTLITSFFYICDHFPDRVLIDYLDNVRMWKVIMGLILFSETISEGKLHDDINEHFKSLENYIDPYAAAKFKTLDKVQKPIITVFDLFDLVIEKLNDWLLNASDEICTMYGKEMVTIYFVFSEISTSIYLMYYKLNAASKKGLTINEVNNIMNMTLRVGTIHSIRRSHGEVRTETTSGDNKAFKLTSMLVPQTSSNKMSKSKDRTGANDPSKRLHVSIAEIGGYLNLPKSEPDGRSRANLCQTLGHETDVMQNPKFKLLLDSIQEDIRRS